MTIIVGLVSCAVIFFDVRERRVPHALTLAGALAIAVHEVLARGVGWFASDAAAALVTLALAFHAARSAVPPVITPEVSAYLRSVGDPEPETVDAIGTGDLLFVALLVLALGPAIALGTVLAAIVGILVVDRRPRSSLGAFPVPLAAYLGVAAISTTLVLARL